MRGLFSSHIWPMAPLIDSVLPMQHPVRSGVQIGPGQKTIHTLHKPIYRSKWSGADIRAMNKRNGVGPAPKNKVL